VSCILEIAAVASLTIAINFVMTIKTASAFRRKRSALWVALIALVVVLFAG